jgi:twitching motility protein PilT
MDPPRPTITEILQLCEKLGASDVHLTGGTEPYMRVRGDVVRVSDEIITAPAMEQMAASLMSASQREEFVRARSIDFAFTADSGVRYRANVFRQRSTTAMSIRRLDNSFRSFQDLTLPQGLRELSEFPHGLVLVTGPTGSGKSTTLATLIHQINMQRRCHIITIEDPLEFLHENQKALVRQRELHTDVPTFAAAIRAALREDPDVLLVGEMRDLETIRTALVAAETGHLVFSTLHTNDVVSTVSRIVTVFPAEEQNVVREQVSRVLRAVVSQRMLLRQDAEGRVPAMEIMRVTPAVANLIRVGDLEQIYSVMQTGGNDGMLLLEQSLAVLLSRGLISREEALRVCRDPRILDSRLRRVQEMRLAL